MINKKLEPAIYARILQAYSTTKASDVAKKLGKSRSSVSQWKKGENAPELSTLIEISRQTGTSLHWIVFGVGPQKLDAAQQDRAALTDSTAEILNERIASIARNYGKLTRDQRELVMHNLLVLDSYIEQELKASKAHNT